MMVPRSFRYSSQSSPGTRDHRRSTGTTRPTMTSTLTSAPNSAAVAAAAPARPERRSSTTASPATLTIPPSNTKPVTIPTRPSSPTSSASPHARSPYQPPASSPARTMPAYKSASLNSNWRRRAAHDPDALPPAVAALLAVTAIPPRRAHRNRSKSTTTNRRISIEELVSEWKSDESLKSSYGSSPVLNVLLEDAEVLSDDGDQDGSYDRADSLAEKRGLFTTRSASSDSMPSLEADDRSVFSLGSPSTPESLHSRRSYSNLKKEKTRSLPAIEDCAFDHPLANGQCGDDNGDDEFDIILPLQKQSSVAQKSRFSFKSNLTISLQSLKNAAINSISSFGRSVGDSASSASVQHRLSTSRSQIDDMLWSHPFLFPRFTSEIRPADIDSDASLHSSHLEVRPLTFEEQEAPFQKALHAPYLAEQQRSVSAPLIQMQTYHGGGRSGGNSNSRRRAASSKFRKLPSSSTPDPKSEAGRALLGNDNPAYRQREVRENSDFLRVVVLEMNMRREGKLEVGRARIWLPPRDMTPINTAPANGTTIPRRWVGESAY